MTRRRPRPLVADSLLALLLACASLVLIDTGQAVEQGSAPEVAWTLAPPPRDVRPGDVWHARIVTFLKGRTATPPGAGAPLLTIQNTSTGDWTTREAKPTGVAGFYRARVVFRQAGDYTYSVLLGDGLATVPVRAPGKGPADAPVEDQGPETPAGLILLTLASTLPIALRRRLPLAVLGVTLAAALGADNAYDNFGFLGPLVALYSVGAHVPRPISLAAAGGTGLGLALIVLGDDSVGFWEIFAIYAVFATAWLLGDNLRNRRDRAARLAAERQANVQRAAAEEQARVARELHDIIGHSVSVMTIQAAAAGDAFDSRPAQVREALGAIESTGRETLAELRRLLTGVGTEFAPSPGLENLDALIDRVRAAGLDVELTAGDRPAGLPPSVELSAYRIVQEALTNTLKHAHATKARVHVRRRNGTLEIDVVDDGRGMAGADVDGGHGIIGMRERVAVFGGHLRAGPAPGGGFAVRARIPVEERPR